MKENVESTAKLVPDVFYEMLAYVIPACVLLAGLGSISDPLRNLIFGWDLSQVAIVEKVLLSFLILGLLYATGQFLTCLSHWVIYRIVTIGMWLLKEESWNYPSKPFEGPPGLGPLEMVDRNFWKDQSRIRLAAPVLGLEILKRFARVVMARNHALVFFLLTVFAFVNGKSGYGWVFLAVAVGFLGETSIRRIWVNNFTWDVRMIVLGDPEAY